MLENKTSFSSSLKLQCKYTADTVVQGYIVFTVP